VSLQYSVAEALVRGTLGKTAYSAVSLRDPAILALARKVHYHVDPDYPGPGRFKGAVKVTLAGGRVIEEVEEYNRGSSENPMTYAELRAKFDENAAEFLTAERRENLANVVMRLETVTDVGSLPSLATKLAT
jgi:2-methylcitrate dehydratase PrpD